MATSCSAASPSTSTSPSAAVEVFAANGVLLRPGDRVVYRPVDAFEYEEIWEGVQAGTYEYDVVDEEFDLNSLTPVSSSR